MNPANRIIVNTGVQYVKAIITMSLQLYSTRLILDSLHVADYGIYMLIAGIVALLGFITNALAITTQRYLSYNQQQKSKELLKKIFANSLFVHLFFGLIMAIGLLAVQNFLFGHVLNIEPGRTATAKSIYVISVFMLLATILTSPYKALLIAHENIVYISIIEIIDSIIKVGFAILLAHITFDRLLVYQWMTAALVFINLLAFTIYGMIKYQECTLLIRYRDIDSECIRRITGFAGWTTYGMGCVAFRLQGTAMVLNHFWGTVINAAYGISCQIFAAISFIVGSILNAMNPQLMQAEGRGDRRLMLEMASKQSKFTTAILVVAITPLILEMPAILEIWLKEVPAHTVMFCRMILFAFMADQISVGLGSAIQAIGQIRTFTLLTYTPKLLFLPVAWVMFRHGCSVFSAMALYVSVEALVAIIRIPYAHHIAGLNIYRYLREVILPIILHAAAVALTCQTVTMNASFDFRFVITGICSVLTGAVSGWLFVLDKQEKTYIKSQIKKHIRR